MFSVMLGSKRKEPDKPGDIIKPSRGSKLYKSIELDNGLTVLLVSDKNVSQGAATMAVRVGSSQDPPEYQGLSHLLEHMVFKGSAEYPKDNDVRISCVLCISCVCFFSFHCSESVFCFYS